MLRFAVSASFATASCLLIIPAQADSTSIVINEVDCHGNDWIEIGNRSNSTIDISGWKLTDKSLTTTAAGHLYVFPSGTKISAKGRFVVQQSGLGEKKLPFGIDCLKGGKIRLAMKLQNGTVSQIDIVDIPVLPGGASYGRYPNFESGFEFTLPTKGLSNKTIKPVLTFPTKYSCMWQKKCSFTITAGNSPKFSLVAPVSGVKIARDGRVTLNTNTKKTYKVRIKLQNQFGSSTSAFEFKVK